MIIDADLQHCNSVLKIKYFKILTNNSKILHKSMILFSGIFVKFKIISIKFGVMQNFKNAFSQPS